MSTAVATRESVGTNLVIASDQTFFNDAQRAALVQMGLGDAPRGDIEAFFHQAKRSGLDPFARQIYMIGRRSKQGNSWVTKYTIQTSIDGFRVIRDRKKTFRGMEEHWCGPDGVWREVWLEAGPPAAARITLYLDGFVKPVTAVARYDEYVPLKDNKPTGQWGKMPALMTSKVAEALALRKAYPQDFSGLYTSDEMAQADRGDTAPAPQEATQAPTQEPPKFSDEDVQGWFDQAATATSVDELGAIWAEAQPLGALNAEVDGVPLGQLLRNLKQAFENAPVEDVQDAEIVEDEPVQSWPVADIPNGDES